MARLRTPSTVSGQDERITRSSSSVGTAGSVFGVRMVKPRSGSSRSVAVSTHQRKERLERAVGLVLMAGAVELEPDEEGPHRRRDDFGDGRAANRSSHQR